MTTKKEQATNRIKWLVNTAASAPLVWDEDGPMSLADWDEMQDLANFVGEELPSRIRDLVDGEYQSDAGSQRRFGERAQRAFRVQSEYGEISSTPLDDQPLLPSFELSESDEERVIKLCGDMRKIVFSSTFFDEPHKKRLLNRIAAIEKQVLSKNGLFDVILGGVSDVGETLGKFGVDIQPLSERMSEIAQITRQGTREYDQIPAPEEVRQLPAPEPDSEAAE